jgi:saccharopine dehydrogenase (NAD+, L-lysine-forming)
MREDRTAAGKILTHAKPPVDDDVVYVHVAAEGWAEGRLGRREFVRAYYPIEIGGEARTAIAWTTAASVAAVIEMARSGVLPPEGFLKQETIPLDRFLETRTGRLFAEHGRSGR